MADDILAAADAAGIGGAAILKLVMGEDFPAMTANLGQNLRDGRARLLQAILQR